MDDLLDIPKLLKLRKSTNIISSYLGQTLQSHLTTLSPLFHPGLLFGEFISGNKHTVKGSDASFKKLLKEYQSLRQKKQFYDKLDELKPPMDVFASALEISPYEYNYQANSNGETKTIRIISPMKWVLGYKNQGVTHLNELLNDRTNSRNSNLKVCVMHHLVMHAICSKRNDIINLLSALRFEMFLEPSLAYGDLPLILVSCPIRTILPSDELIIQSTELSGSSVFEEVLNIEDINQLTNPYKDHLLELLETNN